MTDLLAKVEGMRAGWIPVVRSIMLQGEYKRVYGESKHPHNQNSKVWKK